MSAAQSLKANHTVEQTLDVKRARIALRQSDFSMPKMGESALALEAMTFAFLCNTVSPSLKVRGGQGTGIIVAKDYHGRVFKVELTQVDGPE